VNAGFAMGVDNAPLSSRAMFDETAIFEFEGDLMVIVEDLDISTASGDVPE
jgi:hypothetical protein